MVYKKVRNEAGQYVDGGQVRWDILEVHEAWTPQGKNVGWDEFPDKETARAAYGVSYEPLVPGGAQ